MSCPEWLNQAIDLYQNQHMTFTDIGKQLHVGRKTVGKYLNKAGYQSNPKYARHINPEKLRKYDYSIADSIFDKIDTEEKAYWLGFLYADGYVSEFNNTIELALEELDINHLMAYRSFLGLEDKPLNKKVKIVNSKEFYSYRFSFNSVKAKQALMRLGCTPQKTFSLTFPNEDQIPDYLIHHFIRGYIDGDGCIYTNKSKISIEVLGTEAFLTGYKQWINLGNSKIYHFKHSNIKRVVNSYRQALNILERIYNNATIYLERKHKKYLDYLAVRQEDCEKLV